GATTRTAIIDADAHIIEPADIWTSRLPSRLRDVAPRVERHPDTGHEHWRIGSSWLWPVAQLAQAGWGEYPPSAPWDYADADPASFDATLRLARMDEYGIDVQVLYPNIIGFYAADIQELGADVAEMCVQAYNDFQIEWCSADPRRLVPVATIPFWDRDASVREMQRCAGLGFTSVLFANKFEQIGLPSFVDPYWDPIYAAAQDLDMPVNFHIGFAQSDVRDNITADAIQSRRANVAQSKYNAVLNAGKTVMNQTFVIGNLLLSGVCDRFPRVKLVQVETGFGHIPFYLETLDW
ncbi:MAG TPA: amidohydrolase family protein, partial [Ilumatobacteraceae bacterium]|nr:amidohydrolase family protein [Ilumatobacteraceae bacterium]